MIGNTREDRPWERPGAVRRDCVSHRGPLLRALSAAALLLVLLSFAAAILSPLMARPLGVLLLALLWSAGLGLAVTTYALARRDLALMAAGLMDPAGHPATLYARDLALGACVVVGIGWFIGAVLLS
jgi:hypothetical protein